MSPTFDTTPEKRATLFAFLKRQLFASPPFLSKTSINLTGKTAIVTGSNAGLGFDCAAQLLDLGLSKLIIAVRSEAKGEAAKQTLLTSRPTGKDDIEVWQLNLESYKSILSFIERAKSLNRLDILVNNAGVSKQSFEINRETSHEQSVQVNYLSLALITILMLPIMKAKNSVAEPGHVVTVNSDVPAWAKFKEQDSISLLSAFDAPEFWDEGDRYATSKLLGQLFVIELCKRIPDSVAIINAPNPGLCKSGLVKEFNGTLRGFIFGIFERILARTAAVGARALTDAAVSQGQDSHGCYVEDGRIQP